MENLIFLSSAFSLKPLESYTLLIGTSYLICFVTFSFRRQRRVQHCRIKSRQAKDGSTKFTLAGQKNFDSLYALITYYQINPLKSEHFNLTLTEAIPNVGVFSLIYITLGNKKFQKQVSLEIFFFWVLKLIALLTL